LDLCVGEALLNRSPQKPERRALEQDENAIERWQQKDSPRIKKATRLSASGFLLIPYVAKTWSPHGCTPIHYHRQRGRDKVSVISGISVSPRQRLGLYYQLYFDNIGQEEVCMLLRELLRHLRGQVLVVLAGAPLHLVLA
jgi:hypothetical protein